MSLFNAPLTNIFWDGEVAGFTPDSVGDYYLSADAQADHNYWQTKVAEILLSLTGDSTKEYVILYGGVVSDGGSGTINISEGVWIGKDTAGNRRIGHIPALTGVALPSGWNDNRLIWVIGKYDFKLGTNTRSHWIGTTYHYQLNDTYIGDPDGYVSTSTDDLFVDADPTGTCVCLGSFKMNSATFADYNSAYRTEEFSLSPGRGSILGGLQYRSTTLAPYILPGSYEINGSRIDISGLTATDTNGFIGDQVPRAQFWYYIMMNKSKSAKLQLAEGGYIGKTYSITSISGTNTLNFSSSAGGTQPLAGMIIFIQGATTGTNNGFWTIASVTGSPVTSITTDGTLTNQAGSGGTVKVYYRISTYHFGAGSEVGITTAANTFSYTPSPCDWLHSIGIDRDWAKYIFERNGYYSLVPGYEEYRILGCVYIDSSGYYSNTISYKSGRNKNDNYLITSTLSNGTNVSQFQRMNSITQGSDKIWGNDYVINDDGTHAGEITILRNGWAQCDATVYISLAGGTPDAEMYMRLYNAARTTYQILGTAGHRWGGSGMGGATVLDLRTISRRFIPEPTMILKFYVNYAAVSGYPQVTNAEFSLDVS